MGVKRLYADPTVDAHSLSFLTSLFSFLKRPTPMTTPIPSTPEFEGRPFYGYDSAEVQDGYLDRDVDAVADFLTPRLSQGLSALDCGCGPSPITLGLARAVAPGPVVGIDIEPTMIDRANSLAADSGLSNIQFQVADIHDLPFDDDSFDIVFSSAVLEHLPDPVSALRELRRVTRTGGITAIIRTDWTFPFIVPECSEFHRFFHLFEAGFNRIGGSLNRGRYLAADMSAAGFDVIEFQTRLSNRRGAIARSNTAAGVEGYITWMENIPLFQESLQLGLTTEKEISDIKTAMRAWAQDPDAFIAVAHAYAIGAKR